MRFVERAKSAHDRGDIARSAFILAEGLKREPHEPAALEWLLHIYVEQLPNPGIEREILTVLSLQPNGRELLALVEANLREVGNPAKLRTLQQEREIGRYFEDPPVVPDSAAPPPSDTDPELGDAGEDWAQFQSPIATGPHTGAQPAGPRPAAAADIRSASGAARSGSGDIRPAAEELQELLGTMREEDPIDDDVRKRYAARPRLVVLGGLAIISLVVLAFVLTSDLLRGSDPPAGPGEIRMEPGANARPGSGEAP